MTKRNEICQTANNSSCQATSAHETCIPSPEGKLITFSLYPRLHKAKELSEDIDNHLICNAVFRLSASAHAIKSISLGSALERSIPLKKWVGDYIEDVEFLTRKISKFHNLLDSIDEFDKILL